MHSRGHILELRKFLASLVLLCGDFEQIYHSIPVMRVQAQGPDSICTSANFKSVHNYRFARYRQGIAYQLETTSSVLALDRSREDAPSRKPAPAMNIGSLGQSRSQSQGQGKSSGGRASCHFELHISSYAIRINHALPP